MIVLKCLFFVLQSYGKNTRACNKIDTKTCSHVTFLQQWCDMLQILKFYRKKVKDKATIKTERMRIPVLSIREFGVRGCAVGTEKNNNEYSEC